MGVDVKNILDIKDNINQLVVFNTQNQLVNFICAKILLEISGEGKVNIFAISEITKDKNSPFNKQQEWFENLKKPLNGIKKINISEIEIDSRNRNLFEGKNKDNIKINKDKPILWSITGGQRHLLMQVLICIVRDKRKKDVILYFEGNKNEIHKYNYNSLIIETDNKSKDITHSAENNNKLKDAIDSTENDVKHVFNFDTLGIKLFETKSESEILFNLLGFRDVVTKSNQTIYYPDCGIGEGKEREKYNFYNLVNDCFENEGEIGNKNRLDFIQLYKKLFGKNSIHPDYLKYVGEIRYCLLDMIENNFEDEEESKSKKDILRKTLKDELFSEFSNEDILIKGTTVKVESQEKGTTIKVESKEKGKTIPDFGKFFEKMVYYKIVKIIEDAKSTFANKVLYVELDFSLKDKCVSDKDLDQIDILIFLKTGRLIVIECKVGAAGSDNSKANRFTTYNLSGVYGLPLLVVPHYFKDKTIELNTIKKYEVPIKKIKKDRVYEDNYDSTLSSVDSIVRQAIRCGLQFSTMNTENLTSILKSYID